MVPFHVFNQARTKYFTMSFKALNRLSHIILSEELSQDPAVPSVQIDIQNNFYCKILCTE